VAGANAWAIVILGFSNIDLPTEGREGDPMSKVLLISTHFDDNLEIATMPWAVGNAALAEDKEVTIYRHYVASAHRAKSVG
jgi:hypothetical protein